VTTWPHAQIASANQSAGHCHFPLTPFSRRENKKRQSLLTGAFENQFSPDFQFVTRIGMST
jgi:hypothetical protein